HDHQGRPGQPPEPDDVLAFFYPETVLVPARGLTAERRRWLADLGQFARERALPQLLLRRLANRWTGLLKQSRVETAAVAGPRLLRSRASFGVAPAGARLEAAELYREFPLPGVAPWLTGLYLEGDQR